MKRNQLKVLQVFIKNSLAILISLLSVSDRISDTATEMGESIQSREQKLYEEVIDL